MGGKSSPAPAPSIIAPEANWSPIVSQLSPGERTAKRRRPANERPVSSPTILNETLG